MGSQRNTRNQAGDDASFRRRRRGRAVHGAAGGPCVVVQRRTKDKDGYDAVQLGLVEFIKPQRVNKALTGHFKKAGVAPMRYVGEFRIEDSKDETKPGDRVLVDGFQVGELVDVTGVSKGKGFQGGVKRWHYPRRRCDRTGRCSTARRAASAPVRFLRACGRASIFPGTWAMSARLRRICAW